MSQYIDDYCNDIAREQYNFINDKPIKNNKMKDTPICFSRTSDWMSAETLTKPHNKMKVELIEEELYNETIYWLRIDGSYVAKKKTYEEAKEEFDKAINFQPKTTILESKEI